MLLCILYFYILFFIHVLQFEVGSKLFNAISLSVIISSFILIYFIQTVHYLFSYHLSVPVQLAVNFPSGINKVLSYFKLYLSDILFGILNVSLTLCPLNSLFGVLPFEGWFTGHQADLVMSTNLITK